ncbi:NAD(P)-binding domain-containing protein [Candidatus Gracilibacteria bacterium]|nr:NAD(P)-binding domain-containing protein [Candidatus Gracilibacteria bacterium]
MKEILITDSLFVFPEHEEKLKQHGILVHRLNKLCASEQEIIENLKGKDGYILGGIEKVTDKIIEECSDTLKIISFTGSDWKHFIPGWKTAEKKGIKIGNALGANSYAVAEHTVMGMLAMTRNIFTLSRTGKSNFQTSLSLKESTIGIIGLGKIGCEVVKILYGFGVKEILYFSNTRKLEMEKKYNIHYTSLENIVKKSDIITQHVPDSAGIVIYSELIQKIKNNTIIINNGGASCIDKESLLIRLQNGELRLFQDEPIKDDRFLKLDFNTYICSNETTAYNTLEANKKASDIAVNTIINVLENKGDDYIVSK